MEPAEIKPGESSTLTATFELKDNAVNCNVRVNFGDGSPEVNYKLNQAKDVPLVAAHTYAAAGTYTVKVEPRTKLPMLKCTGADLSTTVKVVAPVAAAAPAAAAATAPACPKAGNSTRRASRRRPAPTPAPPSPAPPRRPGSSPALDRSATSKTRKRVSSAAAPDPRTPQPRRSES